MARVQAATVASGIPAMSVLDADLSVEPAACPDGLVDRTAFRMTGEKWEFPRRHWIVLNEGDAQPWDKLEQQIDPQGNITAKLSRDDGRRKVIGPATVVQRKMTQLDLEERGIKPETDTEWFEVVIAAASTEEKLRPMSGSPTAAQWIAQEIVACEIKVTLPLSARDEIARELVDNPDLGWPTLYDAYAYLDEEWEWR